MFKFKTLQLFSIISLLFLIMVPTVLAVSNTTLLAQASNSLHILAPSVKEDIRVLSDESANAYDKKTNNTTMTQIVAQVIKIFLGLLGVIFVILIIVAGFNWMTAGGNEEKVSKASKLMSRAVIGLIIIVTAYALTYWIFARLPTGTKQLVK